MSVASSLVHNNYDASIDCQLQCIIQKMYLQSKSRFECNAIITEIKICCS